MNFFLLLFNITLFGWTWLRETPEFWLNSGGYPLWLRELTPPLYYPCLLLLMAATGVQVLPGCHPRTRVSLVLWFLAAGVLVLSCIVLVENNVENLLEGRPLHYHPPRPISVHDVQEAPPSWS